MSETVETVNPFFSYARVFSLMAETMTPQERRRVSAELRAFGGCAAEEAYFVGLADVLDEYTEQVAA
jgi:hypothetical protein